MVGTSSRAVRYSIGVVVSALLLLPLLPGSASAQSGDVAPPTEEEVAEARRIFAVGIRHADRGEWEDAVVCFRQVIEVRQAPPVLFNLGAALVALGQYSEAEPLLRRVVDDPTAEATLVERARESITTMETRGGRLTVSIVGSTPSTVVTIDGLVLPPEQRANEFAVASGTHEIVVRDAVDEISRRSITVAAGEHAAITLAASIDETGLEDADTQHVASTSHRASQTQVGTTSDRASRRRRLVRNPWLWTGVGAGIVVLGAVIFVTTYDPPVNAPIDGNTTPPLIRF